MAVSLRGVGVCVCTLARTLSVCPAWSSPAVSVRVGRRLPLRADESSPFPPPRFGAGAPPASAGPRHVPRPLALIRLCPLAGSRVAARAPALDLQVRGAFRQPRPAAGELAEGAPVSGTEGSPLRFLSGSFWCPLPPRCLLRPLATLPLLLAALARLSWVAQHLFSVSWRSALSLVLLPASPLDKALLFCVSEVVLVKAGHRE